MCCILACLPALLSPYPSDSDKSRFQDRKAYLCTYIIHHLFEYSSLLFSARSSDSRFWHLSASGPIPTVVVNKRGAIFDSQRWRIKFRYLLCRDKLINCFALHEQNTWRGTRLIFENIHDVRANLFLFTIPFWAHQMNHLMDTYTFLMREASSKRDCLSVCLSVRPSVTLPLQICRMQQILGKKYT